MRYYIDLSNSADIIDTREVVKRRAELLEIDMTMPADIDTFSGYVSDVRQWTALLDEVRDYAGDSPEDGVTLVRESYWREYAQELADDVCSESRPADEWPWRHIDWEAAADELRVDYTDVDYGGVTYRFR